MIVPTLCVGMHPVTLCVTADAERPGRRSHAERGNDQPRRISWSPAMPRASPSPPPPSARPSAVPAPCPCCR
ncbi:hypothetical protein DBV33_20675 [Pseudomonas fluorescens]|nr:hypothetical protein DBV33_20675 [Pseudomonas fluorescens]